MNNELKISKQERLLYPETLWNRPVYSFSKQAGKIFLIAGSKGKSAAGIQLAETVFRSGPGNILIGFPQNLKIIYKDLVPNEMLLPLAENASGSLAVKAHDKIIEFSKTTNVMVLGPSLSNNSETLQLIWQLIFEAKTKIVICSSAVKALIMGFNLISKKKLDISEYIRANKTSKKTMVIILLPSEVIELLFSLRITPQKISTKDLNKNLYNYLANLTTLLGWLILLKSNNIIITGGNELIITEGEKLADHPNILIGLISSFLSQSNANDIEKVATAIYVFRKIILNMAKISKNNRTTNAEAIKQIAPTIKEIESLVL